MKCTQCDEEYQEEVESCKLCDGEVRKPDIDELTYPKWLLKQNNSMEQHFLHLMHEIENDLNIVDDAFLILVKEYFIDPKTKEVSFFESRRWCAVTPSLCASWQTSEVCVVDDIACVIHRDQVKTHSEGKSCEICGSDLHDVHYVNMAGSGKTQYFVEGEVLHIGKYNPSKLYGRSPVNTMWRQAMTLTAMDNYMYTVPKAQDASWYHLRYDVQSGIDEVVRKSVDEKMERDPHYVPKVGIESQTGQAVSTGSSSWTPWRCSTLQSVTRLQSHCCILRCFICVHGGHWEVRRSQQRGHADSRYESGR